MFVVYGEGNAREEAITASASQVRVKATVRRWVVADQLPETPGRSALCLLAWC